jgi:tetratricopeptide (TPR) repeat protein
MALHTRVLILTLFWCGAHAAQDEVQHLFGEAQQAHARQDLPAAVSLYERVIQLRPALAEGHSNLGLVYYMQGRYEEALQSFGRALKRSPNLFVPVLFSGIANTKMGRHVPAIPLLEQALKQRPGDPQALMYLGLTHAAVGRKQRAGTYFEQLVASAPPDPEALYQLGKNYLAMSVENYARVQTLDPEGFLHKRILARIDEGRNKPPEEIEHRWREIVAARPGYPGMQKQLASVLERAGKSGEATEALKKERQISAVELRVPASVEGLTPGADWALEEWTRRAVSSGRLPQAQASVRALAARYPRWPMPRFLLGELYLQLSLDTHKRLYASDPAGYRALLLDAEAKEANDRDEEAEKAYRAAIAAAPRAPGVHYRLGLLLVKQGRPDESASEFERELEIDAFHSPARLRLGETLLLLDRTEHAITALERVVRDDPRLQVAYVVLGRAYLAGGRSDGAAKALERAVTLDVTDRQARYMLARVYQQQGRTDEAKRELDVFKKLSEKQKK